MRVHPVFQRRSAIGIERPGDTGYPACAAYDSNDSMMLALYARVDAHDPDRPIRLPLRPPRRHRACGSMASPFEHRPWSTFGDADKIAPYNPLRRVPTLVLDNGEALIESAMILDYLDELRRARQGDDRRARRGAAAAFADLRAGDGARRQGASACCTSACCARRSSSNLWVERCKAQISACWRCWKRSAPRSRRRTGSASASATPISRSPACCASPARRIPRCSTRAIRR